MATWRIDVAFSVTVDSDDLSAFPEFNANVKRHGTQGELLTERIYLDTDLGRERIEHLLAWAISQRASKRYKVNGINQKSGTDGELIVAGSEFRSDAVSLTDADVGRVVRVQAPATPPAARGHYIITARNGPDSVTLDGLVPVAATGLTFEINDPAEFVATLVSDP